MAIRRLEWRIALRRDPRAVSCGSHIHNRIHLLSLRLPARQTLRKCFTLGFAVNQVTVVIY